MDVANSFKLFDIRGEYPTMVDERLAFLVGKAAVKLKGAKKILLAEDTRESSPPLKNFLADGVGTQADKVTDLFEVPIPQFYFTMATGDYDLGIMVTASHLGPNENGFKFSSAGGIPFDEAEILALKNEILAMANDPIIVPQSQPERISTGTQYIDAIIKASGLSQIDLKLAVDFTQSCVVTPVQVILTKLKAKYSIAKSMHSGNPLLLENRVALEKIVLADHCDLGLIWDTDGDRFIVIDAQGKLIPTSFVLGLLAREILKINEDKKVVIDVRSGLAVRDLIVQAGGEIQVLPAWGQYLKFAMKADPKIVFGGETSGHYVFRDFYCIDDGLLASLMFVRFWQESNLKDEVTQLSKKYFEFPEKNFTCSPEHSVMLLEKLANQYRDKGYLVSVVDGLTVFGDDFKFNLRQSVTEQLLRLNLETTGKKNAKLIYDQLGLDSLV